MKMLDNPDCDLFDSPEDLAAASLWAALIESALLDILTPFKPNKRLTYSAQLKSLARLGGVRVAIDSLPPSLARVNARLALDWLEGVITRPNCKIDYKTAAIACGFPVGRFDDIPGLLLPPWYLKELKKNPPIARRADLE